MGISSGKVQMNVYVPPDIDAFVNSIHADTKINKSDFVYLLLAYARRFFDTNDIKILAGQMQIFGEEGLEEVRCKNMTM